MQNNSLNKLTNKNNKKQLRFAYKILIICLVLGLLALVVYYYISLVNKTDDIWDYVSDKTAVILRVNNVQEFKNFLSINQVITNHDSIFNFNDFVRQLNFFDSIFSLRNHVLRQWQQGQLLFLLIHAGSDNWKWVILKDLNKPNEKSNIIKHLDNYAKYYEKNVSKDNDIRKYVFLNDTFYLSIHKGICVFAAEANLISELIERSKIKKTTGKQSMISQLSAFTSRNCLANVFLNYKNFSRLISRYINSQYSKAISFLSDFADWTTFDIVLNENPLLMTGYTIKQPFDNSFLAVFANNEPQNIEFIDALPSHTTEFIWLGFDSYMNFRENYRSWLLQKSGVDQLHSNLLNLQNKTKVQNIENYFLPFTGNQMATFVFKTNTKIENNDFFAIIKIEDIQNFKENLSDLFKQFDELDIYSDNFELLKDIRQSRPSSFDLNEQFKEKKANNTVEDENFQIPLSNLELNYHHAKKTNEYNIISYRNHQISLIPFDYFIYDLYGPFFDNIEKTWFTIYKNYFVVANSSEALKKYLDFVLTGKTLEKSPRYSSFSNTITAKANIYIYFSPALNQSRITNWLLIDNESITNKISKTNLQSLALQFIVQPTEKILTNLSFHVQDLQEEEDNYGWEVTLDGLVIWGPWFVNVKEAKHKYIVCADAFLNLYFFSEKGELIWKKTLPEQPIGKVWEIDYYKNNKIQYLLASENQLFLYDRNGDIVKGFPINLPVPSAGPISVFDYDKQNDYRILYPGIDSKIYNITLQGKPPQGWNIPQIPERVIAPVKHVRVADKDLLIVRDQNNALYVFNRRGEQILNTELIVLNQFSDIYSAPNLCRGIVSSTNDGQVVMISTLGQVEYKTVHRPKHGHVFLYVDMNNDAKEDYVFIEAGQIYILQTTGELIAKHKISESNKPKASIIPQTQYGNIIYTFSADGKEIFIANYQGRLFDYMKIPVSQDIDYYVSSDNNRIFVLSAFNNTVFYNVLQ